MNKIVETIGWIGIFLLAISIVPEVYIAFTTSKVALTLPFLLLLLFGMILSLVYTVIKSTAKARLWPLIANYVFEIICLSILLYFKIFG